MPPEQALKELRQRLEAAEAEARAARKDATDAQGEVQQMRADQRARALAPPPAPAISVPTISGAPAAAQARNNSGLSDMRRASWSLTSDSSSRSHMDADRAVTGKATGRAAYVVVRMKKMRMMASHRSRATIPGHGSCDVRHVLVSRRHAWLLTVANMSIVFARSTPQHWILFDGHP